MELKIISEAAMKAMLSVGCNTMFMTIGEDGKLTETRLPYQMATEWLLANYDIYITQHLSTYYNHVTLARDVKRGTNVFKRISYTWYKDRESIANLDAAIVESCRYIRLNGKMQD